MAARFIEDVQTVISREKDPAAFGVITIGAMEAGSARNIIPDQVVLHGTIRTLDDGVRTVSMPFTLSDFELPLAGGPVLNGDRAAILHDWGVRGRAVEPGPGQEPGS